MMLSLAQFELRRIRESWQSNKSHAVDRGIHISPRVPPGYTRGESDNDVSAKTGRRRRKIEGPLVPDPEYAPARSDRHATTLAARLVREPEPARFGTLLAHADPAAANAASAKKTTSPATRGKPRAKSSTAEPRQRPAPAATKPDDSVARQRLEEARKTLKAAEAEARQARRRWEQTQRDLEKAQAATEKAQRELDRVHRR